VVNAVNTNGATNRWSFLEVNLAEFRAGYDTYKIRAGYDTTRAQQR
jgi:hypothetical protein